MRALAQLARKNSPNQDAIARAGGVKFLVGLLADTDIADVQLHAACALMELCAYHADNQVRRVR